MEFNSIFTSTEFQISLLMFVALAGYLIAYRINQSAVVGIILAGIIVGPSVLGFVTYTNFVQTLAHLGAVVLLFTIGLEFNISDILKIRYFLIALIGIILPALGGYFLASIFGYDFKASIFFVSLGVIMDLHAITLNVLWFVLALSAVEVLTKVIGCGIPAKFQHMSLRDSLTVGIGMVPRGEVAMIIALIGLSQNLINQSTYSAIILMSLLTTIIPPLILRNWIFKTAPQD